jgi:probable LLM family oxidoreductase
MNGATQRHDAVEQRGGARVVSQVEVETAQRALQGGEYFGISHLGRREATDAPLQQLEGGERVARAVQRCRAPEEPGDEGRGRSRPGGSGPSLVALPDHSPTVKHRGTGHEPEERRRRREPGYPESRPIVPPGEVPVSVAGLQHRLGVGRGRLAQHERRLLVAPEQREDLPREVLVAGAGPDREAAPLRDGLLQRLGEDAVDLLPAVGHRPRLGRLHRAVEPGSCPAPVPLHRRHRTARHEGDLLVGESPEEAIFGQPAKRLAQPAENLERLVQGEHIRGALIGRNLGRFLAGAAAAVPGQPDTRVIHQEEPHGVAGKSEEVGAVGPVGPVLPHQSEVDLVNQRGGGESLARTVPLQALRGEPAQIFVDAREHPIQGLAITGTGVPQQLGSIGVIHCRFPSYAATSRLANRRFRARRQDRRRRSRCVARLRATPGREPVRRRAGYPCMSKIELGLDTFGDVTSDADGRPKSPAQVLRDVAAEAELADQVGVDFFGVGEHHRPDFAISAPEVLLGAIAARTGRIRLGTAVTVLSTDDPIRVYQRFSTLDAVSGGRAEVILGRGSFTESFPLFGHSLEDYDRLFEEKLALFAAVREADRAGKPVHWKGSVRPPVEGVRVHPPVERPPLRTWVGVGGSPESVVRAARYAFPLTLAIIGGDPRRFAGYVELYQRALAQLGHGPLPIGIHSPGHVADSDDEAREQLWPAYRVMRDRIGRERGWPPISRAEFEQEIAAGSLYVGSPATVSGKIAAAVRDLGASRFDLKYSAGTLSHERMLRSIELYGREVIPRVRALLGDAGTPASPEPAAAGRTS